MLNEEQQQAKDNIQNFIRNGKGVFGLIGAGGTGKTYLITSLPDVENYQFLAPTNKAVNILRQGLIKNGVIKPNVKTIEHGGTNELDNLQALCKTCHKMKTHEQTKQSTIGIAISCGH
jgi:ABC-type dipeptide/oligopeptide/nickel transport system ATPase component